MHKCKFSCILRHHSFQYNKLALSGDLKINVWNILQDYQHVYTKLTSSPKRALRVRECLPLNIIMLHLFI